MARRLITAEALLCDWHAARDSPEEIDASTQRIVAPGKVIDLCGFCALIWDFCGPRIDEITEMIRPEVLEAVVRSARVLKDDPGKPAEPLQLAMPEETTPAEQAIPPPPPKPAAGRRGQWIDGVEQVICPLPHRTGSPTPYYVLVRDRGSHAKGSHKKLGPEIPYQLLDPDGPDGFTLNVKCFKHQACADAGGYGFRDDNGLRCHILKSKKWPLARSADTAATPAQT